MRRAAVARGADQVATGTAPLEARVVVARPAGWRLDVALDVHAGEVVAIMGPSGAGKSTLLGALAGLERITDGEIRIGGETIASRTTNLRPERRGVALLGQDPRLFPHLSARENIAFGPRSQGVPRARARADADEWIARVGLDGFGARRPSELSGGQQQRVAIARALAARPRLLLLDEPLTSLDAETAGEIRGLLQEQLAAAHTTTLFATHDAVDAVAVARSMAIIEAGALTQSGTVRDVLASPATRFVAAVAGLNRVVGVAHEGHWRSSATASTAVTIASGSPTAMRDGAPLAVVFRPTAVQLDVPASFGTGDGGEPGAWMARVVRLEPTTSGVRVLTDAPAVAVDVSTDAVAALGLSSGMLVKLRVASSDVRLLPVPS